MWKLKVTIVLPSGINGTRVAMFITKQPAEPLMVSTNKH